MALTKLKSSNISSDAVTANQLAPGAVTIADIPDNEITMAKLSQVNLDIAPEVLGIQVDSPATGQDVPWIWTWQQSTLPYARRTITNSPETQVPLYKQGTYVIDNFAAYDLHDAMTQVHGIQLKWVDGAGSDNLVSWSVSNGPVTATHASINGGISTQVQRLTVNVPSNVVVPTLNLPTGVTYDISHSVAGAYTFSNAANGNNPNIGPLYRGATYIFNITASGHPFYITTDNGTNFAAGSYFGEYTTGVTNSRAQTGQVAFTVPADAPDTLYYQCGNHSAMRGAITVKELAVETNNNGNMIIYAQHHQEGMKTPVEIRPIPSLVNQMCLVYDGSSGKFVPQDLATYVENTPSFRNKIQEVAGTATLVAADGTALVAAVNVYGDSTYLPLVGNKVGDFAFATDNNSLYIWDGGAWQVTKARSTDELAEGSVKLYYTDARVAGYLSGNGYATASSIIADITASAPSTLDTLNELAAALGDDPSFATTVTNSIATKAPHTSPSFTGNIAVTGTVDGRDVSVDGTKLDGIETGATADQTAAELLAAIKTVDGAGSGLDADLLDGLQGSLFLRNDISNSTSGVLTAGGFSGTISTSGDGQNNLPFKLGTDYSSYMVAVSSDTWGLFWAGSVGARYGSNGNGGPGNIWSNATNPNEFVFIGGDLTRWTLNGNDGSTWQNGSIIAVGNITAGGDVVTNSDIRLKSEIEDLQNSLSVIQLLHGKTYTKDGKRNRIGLIAQEVEEVLPQLVHTADDEMGTKSVNYQNMVAILIEAIKEQQIQIDGLQERLNGI